MGTISEQFSEGRSIIHGLDPRVRLIAGLILTVPMALITRLEAALPALLLGIMILVASTPPLHAIIRRLKAVNFFVIFLWIFLPFSLPGKELFSIFGLTATHEGVFYALLLTIKTNAIFMIITALVGTIPVPRLGAAMQNLGMPAKLCHLLLFTYRYLFVIHEEYRKMIRAAKARGFKPRTNVHTYKTYAFIVAMLLVKSWDRSDRVYQAMICRGFHGKFHTMTTFRTTRLDWLFLTFSITCASTVTALELMENFTI